MRRFCACLAELDRTDSASEQVTVLEDYFRVAPPDDAAWALWMLSGQSMKRPVKTSHLREWAAELADVPLALVEECYRAVGDLAETLALLVPQHGGWGTMSLAQLVRERYEPLAGADPCQQKERLRLTWAELDPWQRYVWNRLLTSGWRSEVPRGVVVGALARLAGLEVTVMSQRLSRHWRPIAEDYLRLVAGERQEGDDAVPFPFCTVVSWDGDLADLGNAREWQCEWKWGGIRAQLVRRGRRAELWSWEGELITGDFPELVEIAARLPEGTVLEGEIVAWRNEAPLPFDDVSRRLKRRKAKVNRRLVGRVLLMTCDLLEAGGEDWRPRPLAERREAMEALIARADEDDTLGRQVGDSASWVQGDLFLVPEQKPMSGVIRVAPLVPFHSWKELERLQRDARSRGAEGVILKRRDSPYSMDHGGGGWVKWEGEPWTCAAVLVAVQPAPGKQSARFTVGTFAVWCGEELVPVAKTDIALTDEAIDEIDAFVRRHTTRRLGPLRLVEPVWVFELAFAGLAVSPRARSGLALRSPRILRRRPDTVPSQADSVATLQRLAGRVENMDAGC